MLGVRWCKGGHGGAGCPVLPPEGPRPQLDRGRRRWPLPERLGCPWARPNLPVRLPVPATVTPARSVSASAPTWPEPGAAAARRAAVARRRPWTAGLAPRHPAARPRRNHRRAASSSVGVGHDGACIRRPARTLLACRRGHAAARRAPGARRSAKQRPCPPPEACGHESLPHESLPPARSRPSAEGTGQRERARATSRKASNPGRSCAPCPASAVPARASRKNARSIKELARPGPICGARRARQIGPSSRHLLPIPVSRRAAVNRLETTHRAILA